jgi:hypothetical protein
MALEHLHEVLRLSIQHGQTLPQVVLHPNLVIQFLHEVGLVTKLEHSFEKHAHSLDLTLVALQASNHELLQFQLGVSLLR